MEGQICLFDQEVGNRGNSNTLEVVKCRFMESVTTDDINLFLGYKYLYAVTFSYGLGFIDKVSKMFEHMEVIIGSEFIPKYDLKEIMAFQTKSLQAIRRHKVCCFKV